MALQARQERKGRVASTVPRALLVGLEPGRLGPPELEGRDSVEQLEG